MKVFASIRGCASVHLAHGARCRRLCRLLADVQGPPGLYFDVVQGSVAPTIRIQIDTSFVADLIHNIQYDSGDHREPESIHQTNRHRRLNNRGQVPLNR